MKKLLITGFDPFDGASVNPSWEAVKLLPEQIGNYELCKLQIPPFSVSPLLPFWKRLPESAPMRSSAWVRPAAGLR